MSTTMRMRCCGSCGLDLLYEACWCEDPGRERVAQGAERRAYRRFAHGTPLPPCERGFMYVEVAGGFMEQRPYTLDAGARWHERMVPETSDDELVVHRVGHTTPMVLAGAIR